MVETATSNVLRPGQRALAAIVFTDVVNFSARMQSGEERTLQLLELDFAIMRDYCRQHDGTVFKTTGDGLLMYFASAVQAVACALAIQRQFAANARRRPAADGLSHRVGIHLGDVFVSDEDVMGDGVNIAARLQAEARPGGICISQTVYDVVKNKLELHVTSLGPRELKNISEAVHVYRLLLDAEALRVAQAAQVAEKFTGAVMSAAPRLGSLKAWWLRPAVRITAIAILVAVPVVALAWLWHAHAVLNRQAIEAEAVHTTVAAMAGELPPNAGRDLDELNRFVGDGRDRTTQLRSLFLDSYNFSGLVRYLRSKAAASPSSPPTPNLTKSVEQMAATKGWVIAELQAYNKLQPLRVYELSGTAPMELHVFTEPDRRLYFVWGGAVLGREWAEVKPSWVGAIIVGALRNTRIAPDREVVLGALAFARIYGQPEIIAALQSRRPRADRPK